MKNNLNSSDSALKLRTMKNAILTILFSAVIAVAGQAQKFAYVDTDYILRHMPEYTEAQAELDRLAAQWQTEIEAKYDAIRQLEQAFQAEKVLLTEEMRQRREGEIKDKRKEAQEMQKLKFGVDGELFNKRTELIKPVQDKLYEAIQEVATDGGYMVVFDKSNQSNMLYTNPKHDVSDKVIKKMGYTPGETVDDKNEDGKDAGNGKGTDGGKGTQPGGSKPGGDRGGSTVPNTMQKK
ncbi:MAG: hypothetical protein RL226_1714 [Bacteroidota bacterium]